MKRLLIALALLCVGCGPGEVQRPTDVVYTWQRGTGDQVPIRVIVHRDGQAWLIVGTDTHRWDVWRCAAGAPAWIKEEINESSTEGEEK